MGKIYDTIIYKAMFPAIVIAAMWSLYDMAANGPARAIKHELMKQKTEIAYQKAIGKDNSFDISERTDFLRSMGYKGIIESSDVVKLYVKENNQYELYVGVPFSHSTKIKVPSNTIDNYIN